MTRDELSCWYCVVREENFVAVDDSIVDVVVADNVVVVADNVVVVADNVVVVADNVVVVADIVVVVADNVVVVFKNVDMFVVVVADVCSVGKMVA